MRQGVPKNGALATAFLRYLPKSELGTPFLLGYPYIRRRAQQYTLLGFVLPFQKGEQFYEFRHAMRHELDTFVTKQRAIDYAYIYRWLIV